MPDQPTDPPKQQFNVSIPADLARRVKHRAVDDGTSISSLVEAALRHYLNVDDERSEKSS